MVFPWILKYKPKSEKEIINQKKAIFIIKEYLKKFPNFPKRALLLYGPPGTGKTCTVHALANDFDYEVIELNASDVRNAKKLEEILIPAMKNRPFFKKGRIILLDEIDGLSAFYDRGAINIIKKVINESRWPVILIANDPWTTSLKYIRPLCELVEFKSLSKTDIYKALKYIAEREGIEVDDKILYALAERSSGDLRSAINDFQTIARKGKKITFKDLEILGYRERETTIFKALAQMFKSTTLLAAILPFSHVDMDPQEIIPWIEENIPNEYEKIDEIYEAYKWMSLADLFYSRIFKRQYWGLLKYYTTICYGGVALAKKERYKKFTKYRSPEIIKKLAKNKELREYLKNLSTELAQKTHTSKKRAMHIYLLILRYLLQKYPDVGIKYGKALGFLESQLEAIRDFKVL